MFFCPFCKANLSEKTTFCANCGYSIVLSLPFYPLIEHKSRYILVALVSMVLGITSCALSFFSSLCVFGLILVVPAIAFGAISLEGIAHKLNGKFIRLFAVSGLVLGILSYLLNIFVNSEVGTSSGL